MKKSTFCIVALFVYWSAIAQAEEPSHMFIHQLNGNAIIVDLSYSPRLEFESENLVVIDKNTSTTLPYDKIERLTFNQALASAVENSELFNCCVIVTENLLQVKSEQTIYGVQVWNIQGQLIYSLPYGDYGLQLTIPATWNTGTYIVGVEAMSATTSHKIIIH